jgi:hypothetical protein
MTFIQSKLSHLTAATLGALALMSAAPSMAAGIDFEAVGPNIYGGGETVTTGGYTLTVIDASGGAGFAGAVLDGSDPSACEVAVCPVGNTSLYYAGVNDGSLKVERGSSALFTVSSLDYGFLAPFGGLGGGYYGQLTVTGTRTDGSLLSFAYDFPVLNSAGASPFISQSLVGDFGGAYLTSLTIGSCMFDGNGGCFSPLPDGENLGQFVLDNLVVAAVPEPETYAMMGLGLGLVGWASRRRSKAVRANTATTMTA